MSRPAVRQHADLIDFTLLRAEIVRFRAAPGRLPTPGLSAAALPQAAAEPVSGTHGYTAGPGGGQPTTAVAASSTDAYDEPELLTPDPTVADLVARSQAGEPEAFGLLYDRYVDLVYRYIYYRVGSPTLAEDLVSETFLRALRRIDSFTWQGRDFAAWLVTIARNLIADHFKSGRYRLEITTEDILESRTGADDRRAGKPGARLR